MDKNLKSLLKTFLIQNILSYRGLFRVLRGLLFDDQIYARILSDDLLSRRIFGDSRAFEKIFSDEWITHRLFPVIEFQQTWRAIRPLVQAENVEIMQKFRAVQTKFIQGNRDIKNLLMDVICEGNQVFLVNGIMKFPDRQSLWTLIHEILINEEYYFEANTDSPRILDCGTHFGLAIYYFKNLYPKSKITGFEPVPALRELALENVRLNNYDDVEILPYALADTEQPATFFVSNSYSMAGSLTKRRFVAGDEVSEIEVECRKLSEFLYEPIHFLKLDIEGSEDVVLAEAKQFLGNVQYIFCEYHHGSGLDTNRLGKLILLLDQSGFNIHVNKSFHFQYHTHHRPCIFIDHPYSAVIWAKNRNWKCEN